MGIQLRIALKNEVPQEFELNDMSTNTKQQVIDSQESITDDSTLSKHPTNAPTAMTSAQEQGAVVNGGNTNGQG
jgi:hypothetical protein